jgi:hypothetical protein
VGGILLPYFVAKFLGGGTNNNRCKAGGCGGKIVCLKVGAFVVEISFLHFFFSQREFISFAWWHGGRGTIFVSFSIFF